MTNFLKGYLLKITIDLKIKLQFLKYQAEFMAIYVT